MTDMQDWDEWEEEPGEFRWEIIDEYSEFDWRNKSMRGSKDAVRSIWVRVREGFGNALRAVPETQAHVTVTLGADAEAIVAKQFEGSQSSWWTALEEQPVAFRPRGGTYQDCAGKDLVLVMAEEADTPRWGQVEITLHAFSMDLLSLYFVDFFDRR